VQSAVTGAGAHTPPDPDSSRRTGAPATSASPMDERDRQEMDLWMSFAPQKGDDVIAERAAMLPAVSEEHRRLRDARELLADDAEWLD
jgi:hypothetical protein